MGSKLGPLYHALYNDVIRVNAKWLEFDKLFGRSKQRVDLLNRSAAFFFRVVQNVMWDDILLHIARLTDRCGEGNKRNLTLRRLPGAVEDEGLAKELQSLLKTALQCSIFARKWRNKRLAHTDFDYALGIRAEQLPDVSRRNVGESLASFGKLLNHLNIYYLKSEVCFDRVIAHEDAELLIHHLAVAARSEDRRMERLNRGKAIPEDFERFPEI